MLQRNLFSSVDGVSVSLYVRVLNNFQNFTICKESLNLESSKQKEPTIHNQIYPLYVYWYSFNDLLLLFESSQQLILLKKKKITWIIIISNLAINPFL